MLIQFYFSALLRVPVNAALLTSKLEKHSVLSIKRGFNAQNAALLTSRLGFNSDSSSVLNQ